MIKSTRKISLLSILIAVCAVCAFIGGMLAVFGGSSAVAEDEKTRVSFALDSEDGSVKEILPGESFTLTITFKTFREEENIYWDTLQLHIGPLNDDNLTLNTDILKYWTWDNDHWEDMFMNSSLMTNPPYSSDGTHLARKTELKPDIDEGEGFYLSIAPPMNKRAYIYCANQDEVVLSARFTISEDIDPEIESFTVGIQPMLDNGVGYGYNGVTKYQDLFSTDDAVIANSVTIKIRQPGTEATLDELTVGHPNTEKTFSVAEDAEFPLIAPDGEGQMTYSSNCVDLSSFTVKPVATQEYAKIEISLKEFDVATADDEGDDTSSGDASDDSTDDSSDGSSDVVTVASGESATLTLQPGENTLYIRVTSEDGKTTLIYTVKITMAYVRIGSLTTSATSAANGKAVVSPDLDSETFDYTLKVPDDITALDLTATVLNGYDASTTIAVAYSDNLKADDSFTSADTLAVTFDTDSEDEFFIKLSVTASDGETVKTYSFSLEFESTETGIKELKAIGVDTSNELANNEALLTDEIDYYFFVTSETTTGAVTFTITVPEGASVAIFDGDDKDTEYDNTVQYTEGTYKIVVTAAAGNTEEYIVVLGKQMFLKLAEGSKYAFLHEYEYVLNGASRYLRTTYAQLGLDEYYGKVWEHGVDDTDLERVVLGQIPPSIFISELLQNLDPSQIPFIRIYDNSGVLLYDCGQPAEGLTEEILATNAYRVATGWCIKYGSDVDNADVVYLSVLGDLAANGAVDTFDMSQIVSYILGDLTFDLVEYRLAAYINNGGKIDTFDLSAVSSYILGDVKMDYYYYYPDDSET